MRREHNNKCDTYRGCPRCRQNSDRWDTVCCVFSVLIVFTFVIPVIPVIIIILSP